MEDHEGCVIGLEFLMFGTLVLKVWMKQERFLKGILNKVISALDKIRRCT